MPVIKRIYLLSSNQMTVKVVVNFASEVLADSDPRVSQFVGQYLANVEIWMREQGNFRMERIK